MSQAKPLILIVEDEPPIADLLAEELEAAGMTPHVFHNCGPVRGFLERNFVNLLLLDVGLPDGTGFDILSQAREDRHQTPVIFLTANSAEEDRVKGLNLGADDYIAKPFSVPELLARIRAVLRRTETARDYFVTENTDLLEEPFDFAGATVNPRNLTMGFPDGSVVELGKKELGIVHYLASHRGEVVPRAALIHAVWGPHADLKSRSLDQYIVKVRNSISKHGGDSERLRTVHGVGYAFDEKGAGVAGSRTSS
ncbi:MAG: response regulator transcription factor [Opitutales bacterium]